MQQVKRKLKASCQTGFRIQAGNPLWPGLLAELSAQSRGSSWLPARCCLPDWFSEVLNSRRTKNPVRVGLSLVDSWPVCHIGMFTSWTLGIVATFLASSSQWMAISPLTVRWVSCRNVSLNSSLGTASSSWPQIQTSGNNLLTRFK